MKKATENIIIVGIFAIAGISALSNNELSAGAILLFMGAAYTITDKKLREGLLSLKNYLLDAFNKEKQEMRDSPSGKQQNVEAGGDLSGNTIINADKVYFGKTGKKRNRNKKQKA